jgi:hypothetical protein
MGHLYTSLAAALGARNQHLLLTSKTFRDLMKMIKDEPTTWEEEVCTSFAQGETARLNIKIKSNFTSIRLQKRSYVSFGLP